MSSNKRLKVILSKVDWCGHCKDFLPVFNESKNLIKNNKTLKNVSVDFEVYDMEQDQGIFETKYSKLVDKVEGYPTVFLAQIKNDKLLKTVEIGHAQKSEDFLKLIIDAYKNFSQQTGGNQEDDIYKQKYLKYKAKYTKLKTQFGGVNKFTLIIMNHFLDKQRWVYFIADNDNPPNIETFGKQIIPDEFAKQYPNIVCRADSATPSLIWPKKLDSDFGIDSSRTINYEYQQTHQQKFMNKIFVEWKPPNPSLPINDNLLVITFN